MRGISGHAIIPLGHESDGLAYIICDFFGTIFNDHMIIGHHQGFIIFHIYFFLAWAPFAFGIFNINAGTSKAIAQGAHIDLLFRRL